MRTKTMSVLALAMLVSAGAVQAQKKSPGAFLIGGHVGRGMGSEITIKSVANQPAGTKFETKSGMSYGVTAGYEFGQVYTVYGTFSQANQDVKNTTDDVNLRHLGVGLRYSFGETSSKLLPYVAGEAGQRVVTGEDCGGGGCTDLSMTGLYFGGGVGTLYYFRPNLAFDGSLNLSIGGFTEIEDAGVTSDMKTDSPMNFRINLGVAWFPQKKPK